MDSQEFGERIIALTQTLYRVAYAQLPQKSDREDAVQEALRLAWEKRRQLKRDEYLQTWVIRILLNVCRQIQRSQRKMRPQADIPKAAPASSADLKEALWALEEKYRLPILLCCIEGYSIREAASMLRLPPGTVKTRLRTGKAKLKALLQEEVFGE